MNNVIYYLTSFTTAVFFILLGILCLLIPLLPPLRTLVIDIVLESSVIIFLVGLVLTLIGVVYISYIVFNTRRKTYHIKKGKNLIDIEPDVIDTYITNYLKHSFPNMEITHQLAIKKKSIMVTADFPYIPEIEQPSLTEKIYEDISDILSDKIGCRTELYLSVTFQSPPNTES